jgi:hypothetical protein
LRSRVVWGTVLRGMIEMLDMKAVPLTFALALAAAAPNAATAVPGDPSELLRSGSLRHLVAPDQAVTGDKAAGAGDDQGAKLQIAQGCWYGYWRRC